MRTPSLLLVACMLVFASCESPAPSAQAVEAAPVDAPRPTVVLPGGQKIDVEIAADPELRAQGLMYRESLPRGKGMLFIFVESGVHPFWMKNTMIPLDMIWIDEAKRIVHIRADVPPCTADPCPSYDPGVPAKYVLELPAGDAAFFGLETGRQVEILNTSRFAVR